MHLRFFAQALAVIALGAALAPAQAGPITRIIAFGDSNVDTGNAYAVNPATVPAPHVNGRYSNGPLTVEYLADALGVVLTSYGFAGAWSGTDNNFRIVGGYSPDLANTGVQNQLTQWQASLAGSPTDPDALYVYWAGSNDLFGADSGNLQSRIDGVKANLTAAMQMLDAQGAERILVATRTPRQELNSTNDQYGQALNAQLRTLVPLLDATYGARIEVFDVYEIIADMMRNPASFGFSEVTAFCSTNSNCSGNASIARGYIAWDGAHKTTRVLELAADAMLLQVEAMVPVPGTLPLALIALGGIFTVRGHRGPRDRDGHRSGCRGAIRP